MEPANCTTNYFNNQGLQAGSSNCLGRLSLTSYDTRDRVITNEGPNGVVATMVYDNADRVLVQRYPDGGVEQFQYSALGLIATTNQLGKVTTFGYDSAGRKIAETNSNSDLKTQQKWVQYAKKIWNYSGTYWGGKWFGNKINYSLTTGFDVRYALLDDHRPDLSELEWNFVQMWDSNDQENVARQQDVADIDIVQLDLAHRDAFSVGRFLNMFSGKGEMDPKFRTST